jgi:hypothetical protein
MDGTVFCRVDFAEASAGSDIFRFHISLILPLDNAMVKSHRRRKPASLVRRAGPRTETEQVPPVASLATTENSFI